MTDFKAAYCDQWAKAAKNVLFVLEQIKPLVSELFKIESGFGATSDKLEIAKHEKSEPDIFIRYKAQTVAAIEVTGSEKLSFPCCVWIAKHKLDYADSAFFPVSYVLVYANDIRFVTASSAFHFGSPMSVCIGDNREWYQTLTASHAEPFHNLKPWLTGILNRFQKVAEK